MAAVTTLPTPIEAATIEDPEEEDEFAIEDFDASSSMSTSITSSVYSHAYENGRRVRYIVSTRGQLTNGLPSITSTGTGDIQSPMMTKSKTGMT
jgi:hypothetical protein